MLNVIAEIRSASEDVELNYRNIQEAYRTLKMYNIDIVGGENEAAQDLPNKWDDLLVRAKQIDDELIPVKVKFTDTTLAQVKDCKTEVKRFRDDFAINGPAAMDMDMDRGLELLKDAKQVVSGFLQRREQLVRAEKLFNLTITSYPELFELENEVKELEKIYDLYSEVITGYFNPSLGQGSY
jgi:dynein heavy chain